MRAFTERRSVVGTLFKNHTRPTHNFTETFVIYRRSVLKRCTYPVHAFPERSVVDAVSEGELAKTGSVFLQTVYDKLVKGGRSSQVPVHFHLLSVVVQRRSLVVVQEPGVESVPQSDVARVIQDMTD